MRPILIFAAALACSSPAIAAPAYVCQTRPAHVFGFNHYSQRWGDIMVTAGRQFELEAIPASASESGWALYTSAQAAPVVYFDKPAVSGFVDTPQAQRTIHFDLRTLRVQIFYWPGYRASDEYDTPYVEEGSCAPIGAEVAEPVLVRGY